MSCCYFSTVEALANLVCLNCRRLFPCRICGWFGQLAFLFSWRSPGSSMEALCELLSAYGVSPLGLNSWIELTARWSHQHRGENLSGNDSLSFLVFCVHIPGCSRSGCGLSTGLQNHLNSSCLDRATQFRLSVFLNAWDNFFLTLPSISFDILGIYSVFILGATGVRTSCNPTCLLLATAAVCLLFLKAEVLKAKLWISWEDWNKFFWLISTFEDKIHQSWR